MKENRTTEQVIKDIVKDFGEIVKKGFTPSESKIILSSLGSISLDFCLYGGFRMGRMVEISGPESSGKTLLASLATAAYQKDHPNEKVLFMDLEGTFDPTWGQILGMKLDEDHFIYYESYGQSGETILNHLVSFIRSGVKWVVLDSIPKLVPEFIQEEDDMNQKSMGGNAQLLSNFCNRYSGLIHKEKALVIGLNQLRDNLSQYGDPYKTTGGRSWKHECSMRLMVKRGDFFDESGEKIKKKDAQCPAGHYIEMYVLKNKDAPWDRKLGFTKLHYWKGIDYISDLVDVALHFNLIDGSKSGWFGILDESGNPIIDKEGKPIKVNGRSKLITFLRENKSITEKIYYKVRELMEKREPGYLEGFESLLGVGSSYKYDEDGDIVLDQSNLEGKGVDKDVR